MSFAKKIAAGFGALIALNLGIAVFCVAVVDSDLKRNAGLTSRYAEDLRLVERMRLGSEEMVSASRAYLLTGDLANLERTADTRRSFEEELQRAKERFETETDTRLLEGIDASARAHQSAVAQLIGRHSRDEDPRSLASGFEDNVMPKRDDLRAALSEYFEYRSARLDDSLARARTADSRATFLVAAAAALGLALSLGLAWSLTRRLASQFRNEQAANRRAREASQQREDLLAIVSHDLRTPLQAIALGARLLRSTPEASSRGDAARAVASIERSAARMTHLIGDLLDAAAIGQGRLAVNPESCGLAGLVQEAAEVAAPIAEGKSISFRVETPSEALAVVADRDRILQVLSNLLDNAMKFTPAGGEVTLQAQRAAEGIQFTVRDTGVGIAREHLPHLFDRYWQAGRSDRRGVGLGLFISKGIIDAHGGRIHVESAIARGTTFRFTLPPARAVFADGHEQARAGQAQSEPPG